MTSITLDEIYSQIDFLREEDSFQTLWLQNYEEGYVIEDDLGGTYSIPSEDCKCEILEDGRIKIDNVIYQAYVTAKYKF